MEFELKIENRSGLEFDLNSNRIWELDSIQSLTTMIRVQNGVLNIRDVTSAIEAVEKSQASIDNWLHRFTGPISLVCDQYIQYLLTGTNSSIINRLRRGLQPWRCQLSTSLFTPFPINGPPLFPKGPTWSQVNHSQHETSKVSSVVLSYCWHMASRPVSIYR
jgi:hypothetical protein